MSRASRTIRLLTLLLSLTLVMAACGGDDDDSSDGTTTSTSTESADDTPNTSAEVSTSTTNEDGAQDPPGNAGGEGEGLGDPLVFVATLSGDAVVPGPGDLAGRGRIEIESDAEGRLCIDMVAEDLDDAVTASSIREAAAGANGDVVIDVGMPTSTDGGTDTWSDVCVEVADDVVERMNADPTGFHASIVTATHETGAIRGQLEQATIFDLTLP